MPGRGSAAVTATKLCTFPDCGRPGSSRTLCGAHYKQARRGQALHPIAARPARLCTVDGCDKPYKAGGHFIASNLRLLCQLCNIRKGSHWEGN